MVRDGIAALEAFDAPEIMEQVQPELCGQLLGTLGLAYARLGQMEKAMEYLETALAIALEVKDPRLEAFVSEALEKLK